MDFEVLTLSPVVGGHKFFGRDCSDAFKGQKKILYNHGLNKTNF